MQDPVENKSMQPPANKKLVKVRICQNRAIEGVGKAGDEVQMTEQAAIPRMVSMLIHRRKSN